MRSYIQKMMEKADKIWGNTSFRSLVTESIFLIVFAIYMTYYYLDTTMFEIEWSEHFFSYMQLALLVSILARYITTNLGDLKNTILLFIIFPVLLIAYHNVAYGHLISNALLIAGVYGIYYKKICRVYLLVSIPITIYTVLASQLGWVTNLIYNQDGRIRESFGFIYPTDFAAHLFFMIVVWVLLRGLKCTYWEVAGMVLVVLFLHFKSDTRCSEITILLIAFVVVVLKLINAKKKKGMESYQLPLLLKLGCISLPFIFASTMALLCRFYNPENSFMLFLDKLLTGRLKLGKRTFDNYDTTLWGQYIDMYGNGGTLEKPEYYTFIDCSYINILMRFGLIVFCVVILIIITVMMKNMNNTLILLAISIVCLHSMIEHHLFEFYYNIFIILPLASFENNTEMSIHLSLKNKKEKTGKLKYRGGF